MAEMAKQKKNWSVNSSPDNALVPVAVNKIPESQTVQKKKRLSFDAKNASAAFLPKWKKKNAQKADAMFVEFQSI